MRSYFADGFEISPGYVFWGKDTERRLSPFQKAQSDFVLYIGVLSRTLGKKGFVDFSNEIFENH